MRNNLHEKPIPVKKIYPSGALFSLVFSGITNCDTSKRQELFLFLTDTTHDFHAERKRSHVDVRVRELASLRDYKDLALISIF